MRTAHKKRWTALAAGGVLSTGLLVACGGGGGGDDSAQAPQQPVVQQPVVTAPTEQDPKSMSLSLIGTYVDGTEAAAEITAYDALSKRLFVVNGALGTVDVLDLPDPAKPAKVGTINPGAGAVNSVAVHNGIVALAIQATPKTSAGTVAFHRAADLALLSTVTVGALPDMLTFTPDGNHVLVANEGEPNSYGQADSVDPEGSVAVIDVRNLATPIVKIAGFAAYNSQIASLRAAGVRIFGPNATVAQDLEPEYIAVSDDGKTAYVTLQENNAMAVVDIAAASVTAIRPLGYKDHSLAANGLDVSDEDGGTNTDTGTRAIKIAPQPVRGLYMPDAVAQFSVGGGSYLITANEGDAREYTGFAEEVRLASHCASLEPTVFPDADNLRFHSNLGRLNITSTPNGGIDGKNGAGRCTELYTFGARSFTVWNAATGELVYDSGDQLEQRTKALPNVNFNASNGNNNLDGRSASKGPEPEGVTVARFGSRSYAFIGLERVGGVMVYDVSDPAAPAYVTYVNSRDGETGPRGPEGLTVVAADKSPNGKPLLIVGNETSGSTAIYQIDLAY